MERIAEICCGSYEDAYVAYRSKASRIELNSALHLGGLTPSLSTLILTKKHTDIKVIAMLRCRGAGFCYSDKEFEVMKEDALLMMKNGADGLAFGFLTEDGCIDIERTKQIVKIVKDYQGEAVFHRAFDCVKNPYASMELLIQLGIDRVLTSGLKSKAIEGVDMIKQLQHKYGNDIEILAGSGINAQNAKMIMEETGIYQVHSSCKEWVSDPTTSMNDVSYAYANCPHENDYDVVSQKLVEELVKSL